MTFKPGLKEELLKEQSINVKLSFSVQDLLKEIYKASCFGRYDGDEWHEENHCENNVENKELVCLVCKSMRPKFKKIKDREPVVYDGDVDLTKPKDRFVFDFDYIDFERRNLILHNNIDNDDGKIQQIRDLMQWNKDKNWKYQLVIKEE